MVSRQPSQLGTGTIKGRWTHRGCQQRNPTLECVATPKLVVCNCKVLTDRQKERERRKRETFMFCASQLQIKLFTTFLATKLVQFTTQCCSLASVQQYSSYGHFVCTCMYVLGRYYYNRGNKREILQVLRR